MDHSILQSISHCYTNKCSYSTVIEQLQGDQRNRGTVGIWSVEIYPLDSGSREPQSLLPFYSPHSTPERAMLPQASLARDNTQVPRHAHGIHALDVQLWFWGHPLNLWMLNWNPFLCYFHLWFFSARSCSTPIHSTMLATSAYLTQPCVRNRMGRGVQSL